MSQSKSGCGTGLIVIGSLVGLYLLVLFLTWLFGIVKALFVFFGFNIFFFIDNLFAIDPINPIIVWGIWGLLFGSIYGIFVAVKKLKLSSVLIFYPVAAVFVLLIVMGIANKPTDYDGSYIPFKEKTSTNPTIKKNYYLTNSSINMYSDVSKKQKVLTNIEKGTTVEVLETGFYDSKKIEWYKIDYNGKLGFVKSEYLELQSINQKNENTNTNSSENTSSSNNTNTNNSLESNLKTPDGVVIKFINSLGNRDFSAAFGLMTEKRRGNYSTFSSSKGYGGITKTTIYNCNYTGKNSDKYEVLIEYESIDPANKSGRFKQYYYLIPFHDSYLISDIKNIDIQWY
jgi:hypothetical protein